MTTLRHRSGALMLSAILVVSPLLSTQAQAARDTTPPTVQHEPASGDVPDNQPLALYATVKDESGVSEVTLFYRNKGEDEYRSMPMQASGNADIYMAEIPAAELSPPQFEYYIQAGDTGGNQLLRGFYFEPLTVSIVEGPEAATTLSSNSDEGESTLKSNKWLWIGLGALAVGGLAAAAGGGGGGGGSGSDGIDVSAPLPQ